MKRWHIVAALGSVLVLFCLYAAVAMRLWDGVQNAGIFGDMFGGLNAFFASIGAIGIVAAIFLQSQQLQAQREELKLQREELALQREEMAKSRAELAEQARVQRHRVHALVAQLKISALQAGIAAEEIASQAKSSDYRGSHVDAIRNREKNMNKIISDLEDAIARDQSEPSPPSVSRPS